MGKRILTKDPHRWGEKKGEFYEGVIKQITAKNELLVQWDAEAGILNPGEAAPRLFGWKVKQLVTRNNR